MRGTPATVGAVPLCRAPRNAVAALSPPRRRPPPRTGLVVKYFTGQPCGERRDRTDEQETDVLIAVTDHVTGHRRGTDRALGVHLGSLEVHGRTTPGRAAGLGDPGVARRPTI